MQTLDLSTTPLSRRGNWMSLSRPPKPEHQPLGPGLYLRSNHARGVVRRELLKVELVDGAGNATSDVEADFTGAHLTTPDGGWAKIQFTAHTGVRIRGNGCGLRLTAVPGENSTAYRPAPDVWVFRRVQAL